MGAQQKQTDQQEPQEPQDGAQTEQQDPEPGKGGEGAQEGATEPQGDGADDGGKGGATVNRHKYERDLAAKDEKIAELQAQLDEAAKTKEGRDSLQKKLDEMKAELDGEKVAHKLEVAGCLNVKAGRALLDDYDGDVEKLKSECPYLFGKEKKVGSTGKKPEGPAKDEDAELDRAFGLKK